MLRNSEIGGNNIQHIEETGDPDVIPNHKFEMYDPKTHILIPRPSEVLKKGIIPNTVEINSNKSPMNLFYQIVYPDDLNLKPAPGVLKPRGRPKKAKSSIESLPSSQKTKIKVVSRTRSGRTIKFPKHIENEFKKIEITDDQIVNANEEVKISDFVQQYIEHPQKNLKKQSETQYMGLQQKRRKIAAQYRCPKCNKAYLGRKKILEHLKKNPFHGPVQEQDQKNSEVWNYLVCVTQKVAASERGSKFCQELSNLLQNLALLANALFKKQEDSTNQVIVDKVLGNAIGLSPGPYFFDDNNLYRNVSVLKLISNKDFLSSLKFTNVEDKQKPTESNCKCDKLTNDSNTVQENQIIHAKSDTSNCAENNSQFQSNNCFSTDPSIEHFTTTVNNSLSQSHQNLFSNHNSIYNKFDIGKSFQHNELYSSSIADNFTSPDFVLSTDFPTLPPLNICENRGEKPHTTSSNIKIQSDILISPTESKLYQKSFAKNSSSQKSIGVDILSSMQNIQHSCDDFILPVATESNNILDNSSSSDEVMNVDQFVNERFKKITESEMEMNSNSLNLELSNLDIFQFHTS